MFEIFHLAAQFREYATPVALPTLVVALTAAIIWWRLNQETAKADRFRAHQKRRQAAQLVEYLSSTEGRLQACSEYIFRYGVIVRVQGGDFYVLQNGMPLDVFPHRDLVAGQGKNLTAEQRALYLYAELFDIDPEEEVVYRANLLLARKAAAGKLG